MKLSIFDITFADGMNAEMADISENGGMTCYKIKLSWTKENAEKNDRFDIVFRNPSKGILYEWTTNSKIRSILPEWCGYHRSMLASEAPVMCLYDGNGINKLTWSVSECKYAVEYKNGIIEEDGNIRSALRLAVKQFTGRLSTELVIRTDKREIPMGKAIADNSAWWAQDMGMTPAVVPDCAKDPAYSFWYSYHQELSAKEIEEECARAKKLGFDVCIIDDGWQTEDNSRGYAFCGDWEPAPSKIPDMASHVENVHKLGMKYVIWYSVVFMGYKSKHYEEFKDMLLYKVDGHGAGILDPRYKKVREFLINIYKTALTEWKLDGFKLDFIDMWGRLPGDAAPYNERMDIVAVPDAVDVFMTDVIKELKDIKPDILLEFRQSYIGPYMRKYGNMFRVADCPDDYIINRRGIFDLRMLLGESAVHSDMLMWHKEEKPEFAAVQILNIMFGVMQYSARLSDMSERTAKMSAFLLSFLKEKRELLLSGELSAYEPESNYTWAKSTLDDECAVGVYSEGKCVKPDCKKKIYIANATFSGSVIAFLESEYTAKIYNCFGELAIGDKKFSGLCEINIPTGGIAVLEKE